MELLQARGRTSDMLKILERWSKHSIQSFWPVASENVLVPLALGRIMATCEAQASENRSRDFSRTDFRAKEDILSISNSLVRRTYLSRNLSPEISNNPLNAYLIERSFNILMDLLRKFVVLGYNIFYRTEISNIPAARVIPKASLLKVASSTLPKAKLPARNPSARAGNNFKLCRSISAFIKSIHRK